MNLQEKTLASERIYDGRVVSLRVDTVELPDGKRSQREIVEHRGAVAVVPLLDAREVVMVRQYRQAAGEVLIEIPAGTLHPGEEPEVCAQRELIEETGYAAREMKHLFSSYLSPGYSNEKLHTYLATGLYKEHRQRDEDEFVEVVRVELDDVLEMILRGEIKDAKSICGCLLAELLLRNQH